MDTQKFIENFAAQFEETKASLFTKETIFRDIEECDSLIAMSIIAMVDEEYKVTLTGENIRKSTTISDILEIVKSKL